MALYEYRCAECGTEFEKIVTPSSQKKVVCPICSSKRVKRKLSVFASSRTGSSTSSNDAGCSTGGG